MSRQKHALRLSERRSTISFQNRIGVMRNYSIRSSGKKSIRDWKNIATTLNNMHLNDYGGYEEMEEQKDKDLERLAHLQHCKMMDVSGSAPIRLSADEHFLLNCIGTLTAALLKLECIGNDNYERVHMALIVKVASEALNAYGLQKEGE